MAELEDFRAELKVSDSVALEHARARLRAAQDRGEPSVSGLQRPGGRRLRFVVPACGVITLAVAAILVGAISIGDDRGLDPASASVKPIRTYATSKKIDLVSGAQRSVPAPSSAGTNSAPWTLIPTVGGGVCVNTSRLVFCGTDEASVETGRASGTEYPPDEDMRRENGRWVVTPSDGTGTRMGVAPSQATEVVVVDGDDRDLRHEAIENGVYQITVPPQGTPSTIEFRDPTGRVVTRRPAG